jgi:hypothetical protein
MTKDEILSMAKEAGMFVHKEVQPEIKRFAALVAEKERKECAKVLTENAAQCTKGSMNEYILTSNAQAILVRGQK